MYVCVVPCTNIYTDVCVSVLGVADNCSPLTTGFSGLPPAKSRAPQRARKPPPQSQWHQGQYTNLNETGWLCHWGKLPKWQFHDYLMTIDNIYTRSNWARGVGSPIL